MITVIHEQRETELPGAQAAGESLWLTADEVVQSTGWLWKPEGLCLGELCVPIPPERLAQWVRGDRIDLAAMWRHMAQPMAHSSSGDAWVLGASADKRGHALASLQAPDFELPDLDGRLHRLSEYRGRKVFLVSWASW